MRIALVRQRYSAHGGAERFIERAVDALAKRGVATTVVARAWTGDPGSVVRCNPFYIGSLWRDWGFARAACREMARRAFDLVQSHERMACCDVYRAGDGVHAQWLENRRTAMGTLGRAGLTLNLHHYYVLAAERQLFRSSRLRAVICNSRMVKNEIRRRFDIDEEKLHVIYNGVDVRHFHPGLRDTHRTQTRAQRGIPDAAMVYLFVGSGFERKGVLRLLHAFARGAARTAHLVIVGKDKTARHAKAAGSRLGIDGRTHWLGALDDVRPWYGAADAFVLPTLYDPFPNAALEAMACGLPVLTTNQCGAAELIEPGVSGMLCDAMDEAELVRQIGRLDPESARAMGVHARVTAEGYDLDAMATKLVVLYGSLLAATPRHTRVSAE